MKYAASFVLRGGAFFTPNFAVNRMGKDGRVKTIIDKDDKEYLVSVIMSARNQDECKIKIIEAAEGSGYHPCHFSFRAIGSKYPETGVDWHGITKAMEVAV